MSESHICALSWGSLLWSWCITTAWSRTWMISSSSSVARYRNSDFIYSIHLVKESIKWCNAEKLKLGISLDVVDTAWDTFNTIIIVMKRSFWQFSYWDANGFIVWVFFEVNRAVTSVWVCVEDLIAWAFTFRLSSVVCLVAHWADTLLIQI